MKILYWIGGVLVGVPIAVGGTIYASSEISGLTPEQIYEVVLERVGLQDVRIAQIEEMASSTAQEASQAKAGVQEVKVETKIVKETIVVIQQQQASTSAEVEAIKENVQTVEEKVEEVQTQIDNLPPPVTIIQMPEPEPEPEPVIPPKPVLNVAVNAVQYASPAPVPNVGVPDKRRIALFTLFESVGERTLPGSFRHPSITVEISSPQFGLDFSGLRINTVPLEKISDTTYRFPSDTNITTEYGRDAQDTPGTIWIERLPIENNFPDYTLTVTIESAQNEWTCDPTKYSSCTFPTFPITNTVVINPRSS